MASLFSTISYNYLNTNFYNTVVKNATYADFLDNVNVSVGGKSYEDVAFVNFGINGYSYQSLFGGYGFTEGADGSATGGTVTGYLELKWSGGQWSPIAGIEDISYSLPTLYKAFTTSTASDDHAVMAEVLAGEDTLSLSQFNDVARGYTGNDVIMGYGGNDSLFGDTGNDYLFGGTGSDYLDGGIGIDFAAFIGTRDTYQINRSGSTVIDNVSSRDGEDIVANIERLIFSDGNVGLDVGVGQTSGQAYRLYKAAFDREPDEAGLGYWIDQLDTGAPLQLAASGFIESAEFASLYGSNPSDTAFLTKLYNNVLDRDPDQGGLNYWTQQLNHGLSREDALINFSESNENVSNVAGLIENGIHYQMWLG